LADPAAWMVDVGLVLAALLLAGSVGKPRG
jgi:hypothetical protein